MNAILHSFFIQPFGLQVEEIRFIPQSLRFIGGYSCLILRIIFATMKVMAFVSSPNRFASLGVIHI